MASHEAGMALAASEHDGKDVATLEAEFAPMLENVKRAFRTGKTKSLEWRIGQLKALRKGLADNSDAVIAAMKVDLGRHAMEAVLAEMASVFMEIDHVVDNLEDWMKPKSVSHPLMVQPGSSQIMYDPKGVVLILPPWNYPINLSIMSLVSVICAGNAAVIKPSEVAVESGKVVEHIVTTYLDSDCIKCVQGAVPETTALLNLRWDHIFYTGNGAVGRIVMKAASKHLTPVTLELGGKSPAYFDKSCNLSVSVKRLLAGKSMNNGQTCIAPDYVLLDKSIEKEFLKEIKKAIKAAYGSDLGSSSSWGRIINERHWDRITRLLDSSAHGGEVLTGGVEKSDREQKLIPLTLVLNPQLDSQLMVEEIFGPILPIITVDGPDQAVEIITSREHPLALYCFASNQEVVDKFTTETTSGGVCVNDALFHIVNSNLPFGGVGSSGMGSYHGYYGFLEFSHQKAVMYRSTWLDPGVRYPPFHDGQAGKLADMIKREPMSANTKKLIAATAALGMVLLAKL
mmetsp:Transcript_15910/g.29115  ORF Transcript_15910/g.29115 Transcript_15910/m.29115 type:complete len:513 (+) Transcript_15910:156-1694(+)